MPDPCPDLRRPAAVRRCSGGVSDARRWTHDRLDAAHDTHRAQRGDPAPPSGKRKLLRFPFLREGAGEAKRDGIRAFLREQGYRIGYVSIDTSDWLVDRKLREALAEHPDLDLTPWREMYLTHVWDDAQAFDRLAKQLYGRAVKHVILLHHRLLNALFLGDVIDMFRARGWTIIPPDEAFADPAYQVAPMIPRVDGGVLETTARALGVPLQPALAGLWSERQVKEEADRLRARP